MVTIIVETDAGTKGNFDSKGKPIKEEDEDNE